MPKWSRPYFWVLVAFLVACPRLFELGISLDPSLYASIARNFSRTWSWWSLRASENLFNPYYEHPFLPIWIQGIIFYIFGASDFTARLLGLFLGSASFYFIYGLGELWVDKRFAAILSFLTLISLNYVGSFASFYLEVPLTFFMLGALYFFIKALKEKEWKTELLSGVFLGCAFLTKGFAALPMLGMIGLIAIYDARLKIFTLRALWICVGMTLFLAGSFCVLQAYYGKYPFYLLHYHDTFVLRAITPGLVVGPLPFLKKFLEYHPAHLLLAIVALGFVRFRKPLKDVMVYGLLGTVVFVAATAVLGVPFRHYYFPIYPIINILAACTVYFFTKKREPFPWEKAALALGLVSVVFWHLVPFHLRKFAMIDLYQLKSQVSELRRAGVQKLEALDISGENWGYRELSNWYWDVDSEMLENERQLKGGVVILGREGKYAETYKKVLDAKHYILCAHSPLYALYVPSQELAQTCSEAPFEKELLR